MSSAMPELGSKISLISKADIRYEGRLFTVDPLECTIALASVRSFGTEDRETQFAVAPQNQVYDYILFRGSDIKDIRVVNSVPSVPNDPAIMQLSVPASLGGGPQYAAPQYQHPVIGSAQYPQYHPMTGLQQNMRPMKQPSSMLDLIGGNSGQNHSRSATPSAPHRKSPTADQGTQVGSGAGGQREGRRNSNNAQRYQQNQHNQHQQHQQQQHQQHQQQQGGQNQQRNRPNSRNRNQNTQPQHGNREQAGPPQQQQQQHQHQHQHHQQHNNQQHHMPHQYNMQHQQVYEQSWRGRGAWRGRGRGRGGGGGGFPRQPPGGKTLKFDKDYDFEQANTEFEELRSKLAKAKISEDVKPDAAPVVNGTETEKKDDSGNETGAGEAEPEEEGDGFTPYDKTKSFFDNISCEAVERQKGRSQRTDWRVERKLNSETFGVASARRGAWRGRGGWRQYNVQHQPWRAGGRGGRGRGGGGMMGGHVGGGNAGNSRQRMPGAPPHQSIQQQPQPTAAK